MNDPKAAMLELFGLLNKNEFDHTSVKNALVKSLRIINKLMLNVDHERLEDSAAEEMREVSKFDLNSLNEQQLVDYLTQACIDYDYFIKEK